MKLKNISRTATFAWETSSASSPLLVTGDAAGALGADLSSDSHLEIWAPKLYESDSKSDAQGYNLGADSEHGPAGSVTVSSRFNRLAWSPAGTAGSERGVIAAGMESGELALYDPVKILNGQDAQTYKSDIHTGPVRGLDFNPIKRNLLLSGAVAAELYIHDLENPGTPISPGPKSTKLNDITAVQWNPSVQSIFSASSDSGYTTIWDVRVTKEIAFLQYGGGAAKGDSTSGGAGQQMGKRRGMSALAWHPDQATRLVTASEDDESPIILLWDLRNTRAPERILSGHTKGVLSVSWCKQDADLLASCGKDNRALLWNPQSGDIVGELPSTSDWAFETSWCPNNPNIVGVASFDGHISLDSLQATQPAAPEEEAFAADATNDDIFATLGRQGPVDTSSKENVKSLEQAPKWMKRPVSATFGYGGLLASVSNLPGASGKNQSSVVHLRTVITEESILGRAKQLSDISADKDKLSEFSSGKADDPAWKALQALFRANSRDELVTLLGFSKEEVATQVEALVKKLSPEDVKKGDKTPTTEDAEAVPKVTADPVADEKKTELFDDRPVTPAAIGGDADFFASMASGSLRNPQLDSIVPHTSQAADSSVAATVGSAPSSVRSDSINKENNFRIYPAGESDTDRLITQALVLGDFPSAVNLCLASERYADALLLAVRGGPELLQTTQKAYFQRRTLEHPFLRVFQSIVTEDLVDIVQNADLAEWRVVFAVLCTFAKDGEFANLADQLGRRLHFRWQILAGSDSPESKEQAKAARQDATFCYLAARNLERVVSIWINEMQEEETQTSAPLYSAHANALQTFIEKVVVFQAATGYQDKDLTATANHGDADTGRAWALSGLYDRFYEYADLLATQGLTDIAAKYVLMTPKSYKGEGLRLDKARDRLLSAAGVAEGPASLSSTAFGKASTAPAASTSRYAPTNSYSAASPYGSFAPATAAYQQPPASTYGAVPAQGVASPAANISPYAAAPTASPYAPASAPGAPSNPYAPTGGAGGYNPNAYQQNAYGNGYNQTQSHGYGAPNQGYQSTYGQPSGQQQNTPLPPPPKVGETKEHIIPASQRRDLAGWNDAPSIAPKRPSSTTRESTPKPSAITSPFPMSEQPASQYAPPVSSGSTAPPPPRGPPGVVGPPPKGGPRPPSASRSPPVASPQSASFGQQAPPFGQPPQQPPYGNAPQHGQYGQPPQQQHQNPYGQPPQQHQQQQQQFAPPPQGRAPPPRDSVRAGPPPPGVVAGPPPRALSPLGPGARPQQQNLGGAFSPPPGNQGPPPPGSRMAGPPPPGRARTPAPAAPAPAPAPAAPARHPAGDRSHIPASSKSIHDDLSAEFNRVKGTTSGATGQVKRIVDDTERRLNVLYDDLNNDSVPEDTLKRLREIVQAVKSHDAAAAVQMHTDLMTNATTDVTHWAPGIKQLVRLGIN